VDQLDAGLQQHRAEQGGDAAEDVDADPQLPMGGLEPFQLCDQLGHRGGVVLDPAVQQDTSVVVSIAWAQWNSLATSTPTATFPMALLLSLVGLVLRSLSLPTLPYIAIDPGA
jgi:hypothetical protein